MMPVDVRTVEKRRRFLFEFLFLTLTLGPWGLMIWLLWPQR